jgi:hypothetical protein
MPEAGTSSNALKQGHLEKSEAFKRTERVGIINRNRTVRLLRGEKAIHMLEKVISKWHSSAWWCNLSIFLGK